jgi:hypothetical protein
MKRMMLLLCLGVLFVPGVRAQGDHVEAGVFADYFRMSQTDNNYALCRRRHNAYNAAFRIMPS